MGFFDVTGHTTDEDLSSTIVQQIANFQLDISFLRGQCYDGAGMDIILSGKMFYTDAFMCEQAIWQGALKELVLGLSKCALKSFAFVVCQSSVESGNSKLMHFATDSKHDRHY